eukprot:gene5442-10922_t
MKASSSFLRYSSLIGIGSAIGYVFIDKLYRYWKSKVIHKKSLVFKCVLTGGPCGGKSSILMPLKTQLIRKGFEVFTVPEISTLLLSNGAVFPGCDAPTDILLEYEKIVLNMQLHLEDSFVKLAHATTTPSVLLIDRGAIDISAYMPEALWTTMLHELALNANTLLSRYDLVYHLTTAADGAIEHYSNATNNVRTETPQEAILLDRRCQDCWSKHHNQIIADNNSIDFETKIHRAINNIIGEIENHFRCSKIGR